MFSEYMRDPLPSYSVCSIHQLKRFDEEVWKRLAAETRGGLAPRSDWKLPCDKLLEGILNEPRYGNFVGSSSYVVQRFLVLELQLRGEARRIQVASGE